MASFPPETPESQPEYASSELLPPSPSPEPRLLTRREAAGRDTTGRAPHPRPVHHPQTLGRLRSRLRARQDRSQDAPAQPRRRRRTLTRALRRALVLFVCLVLLAGAALITFALFLRHDMRAALPQLDGDLHLAGLAAPVNVTRDPQGVPTIQAASLNDMLFAQGFVTAQDRLWQMDTLRRHAAGELAEVMGPSLLDHDRQQRILQLRAAADRAILVLPPDQLAQLQAYARGVNAFLENNADRLPVEFHLLHYKPAPWTPRDSLLVGLAMFQDLGTSFPIKLRREALSAHLPPELLADLYPTRGFRDQPPTQPRKDLTTPRPEILQIPLDDSQVKLERPVPPQTDPPPTTTIFGDPGSQCPECRSGSNNWAVSGSHTASGKPLLSNDMHLSLGVPDIWYAAGLHTAGSPTVPAFDVTGFTLPGVPFIIVGRNAHVAWGVTNLGGDVQDIHIEHLRGSGGGTEFQQPDGSWAAVAHHREVIHVRGRSDQALDVLTTTNHIGSTEIAAPIISPLYPKEHRALSLLWTPYDPRNLTSPFYSINSAATGSALVAAFASFGGPSLNLVYADDAGHIGYHAVGRIPIRGPAERHTRTLQPTEYQPQINTNPLPDEMPDGESPDHGQGDSPNPAPTNPEPTSPAPTNPGTPLVTQFQRGMRGLRQAQPELLAVAYVRPRPARARRPARPERHTARVPIKPAPEPEPIPVVPVRDYTIGSPIPAVPVDALDATAQWSAYVPYEELPSLFDPADGVLATANARATADDYPYFLSDIWAPPYRVERIRKLLVGHTGLTPADMLRIETDTTSEFDRFFAHRLAYAIDHASAKTLGHEAKRLHQAADLLRSWNGNMTADSAAAAIVTAARPSLWAMLLDPQIARHDHLSSTDSSVARLAALYDWPQGATAIETLLIFQPVRWLPPTFGNWNDVLATALAQGLSQSSAPHDLSRWRYGSLHKVDIEHPVFALSPLLPRLIGVPTGTGQQAIGGNGLTVQATARAFGPSERLTADLADSAATTGNVTTGQSGNPASPHFLDQFPAWLHGSTFALPLAGAPAQHTLRLLP